jgi:hypothetical protein
MDGDLWLHPYLFRQVCRNGAIMAQAIDSVRVEHFDTLSPEVAESALREAVAVCSAEHVFAESMDKVRSAAEADADIMLNMMPMLTQLQKGGMGRVLAQVLEAFWSERDPTRYGLMNAVTSVARETRDPEDRWRLEELGGAIGAGIRPKAPAPAPAWASREPAVLV